MFITMKVQCKQYIKRISLQSKKIIILFHNLIILHYPFSEYLNIPFGRNCANGAVYS